MPDRRALILCLSILAASALTGGVAAAPHDEAREKKLDPFLRRVARGLPLDALPPFVRARRDAGAPGGPLLFVKARLPEDAEPGAISRTLSSIGVGVRARAGGIASLAVPVPAIGALASLPEVRWLKASRSYRLMNEISMGDTFTAARAENAAFADAGEGVIVAVVDTGIDWRDDDFRNTDGTTRVLGIWDQTLTDAAHPPPPGFSFGSFYSRADIDDALAHGTTLLTMDGHGHGSHVAGTAAGNGRHTGNDVPAGTYAGVAPEADLLIVRVFDNVGEFCDACDLTAASVFIDQFAGQAGKPWVGNMSLGDALGGAHDGTSPDELAIDALVGPGRPGAHMAIAAGNEGNATRHSHWEGQLQAGLTYTDTFLLDASTPRGGSNNDFVWLDLWYEGTDDVTVQILTPGNQTVGAARGADSGVVCTSSGAVRIDATNAPDPENGDNEVFVEISDSSSCIPVANPAAGLWTIRMIINSVGGGAGHAFDLWNSADTPRAAGLGDYVDFSSFSAGKMVSIPGTSRNALTAGSYVSKRSWINASQVLFNAPATAPIGSISGFSSTGPTRDGRIKPDIAAPGEYVASSRSGNAGYNSNLVERDGVHANKSGTSMATPHVAGAVALLFGIDPGLDGAQVKSILQRAARFDGQTGVVPNTYFGAGKLRILEAAYEAAAMSADLAAASDAGHFSWSGLPQIDSWNVYRGPLPGVSAVDYGSCFLSGLATPDFVDDDIPPLAHGYLYLVTGVYLSPTTLQSVEGSLGTDSLGRVRTNSAPCP